ncbi:MAG: ATP-binding cassette domain-containing protein [Paracoccus sp. (in: a-proteobacteria)]|nr:ATP-binding cassette domain-containing protein [Paracoccus sp. (in: a-proteobacteria)]
MFDLFPRLAELRWQMACAMSGGEQKMVAIGRALMSQPHFLSLDEPRLGLWVLWWQWGVDEFTELRWIAVQDGPIHYPI